MRGLLQPGFFHANNPALAPGCLFLGSNQARAFVKAQ
jgi:hypothetical protein